MSLVLCRSESAPELLCVCFGRKNNQSGHANPKPSTLSVAGSLCGRACGRLLSCDVPRL